MPLTACSCGSMQLWGHVGGSLVTVRQFCDAEGGSWRQVVACAALVDSGTFATVLTVEWWAATADNVL
jgi:hypothetical protein